MVVVRFIHDNGAGRNEERKSDAFLAVHIRDAGQSYGEMDRGEIERRGKC